MQVTVIAEQLRRRVPGGIGTYVRGLLQGLQELAADGVALPNIRLSASRPRQRPDPLAALGFPLDMTTLPAPVLTRAWDVGVLAAPGGRRADLVHATSLAVPRPRNGIPEVAFVHDLAWRSVPDAFPPRGRRWHEAALARTLRRATVLVTSSSATADALRMAGASWVEVIEEGADHLPPGDESSASALLDRLKVGGPYLLTVSTLEPRKNLPRLIAAYQLVRPRLPEPWPLVVVGPVGWGPALRLGAGVVWAGMVDEATLAALYARARCMVYVPLLEGWGLPPVEAMAAGTPVVASPMPSTAGAALEVDPRDVESIAAGIQRAAGDDRHHAELVAAGLLRAGGLRWKMAAGRHVELWDLVGGAVG